MPHGTTSHVHVPVPPHAPSLVLGIACFLPIHDLAGSLSSLLVLIRLTRPVVYLSPGLCLTILTTVRSLSGRTAVWLNPTHPLRQMSVCLHTLKVTGVCAWDFFSFCPSPSHSVRLLSQGLFVFFTSIYKNIVQGMKLYQYSTTSCHGRRR